MSMHLIPLYILRNWTQIENKYNLTEEEVCSGVTIKESEGEDSTSWTHSGALTAFLVHVLLAASLLLQLLEEVICMRKVSVRLGR